MTTNELHVFIIEPDDVLRDGLCVYLHAFGIHTQTFKDVETLLDTDQTQSNFPHCLLIDTDLMTQNRQDFSQIKKLSMITARMPTLLMASAPKSDLKKVALMAGVSLVLEKPLVTGVLIDALRQKFGATFVYPHLSN